MNLKCDQLGTVICAAQRGDCCESMILIQIEDDSDLFIVSSTRSTEVDRNGEIAHISHNFTNNRK